MIEKLVVAFFQKVEEIEGITSKNGKATFLVELILKKNEIEKRGIYDKITMSMSTATRHVEKYIYMKEGAELKNPFFRNAMAEYLGYDDYNNFVNNHTPPPIKPKEPLPPITNPPSNNWKKIIGISSASILGIFYFIYPSLKTYTSDCIIWKEYQYEKAICSDSGTINNVDFHINIQLFKKINVNKDSEFFRNGKPIIWYGKNNKGIVEYFTSRGKHPENQNELKPITRKVLSNESLLNE